MKKAMVIGGSNGIGLAVSEKLIRSGYMVYILDRQEPPADILEEHCYTYKYTNLLDFQTGQFEKYKNDKDLTFLMITAGFGRIADFEYFHTAEIENMLSVNTVATIKLLRIFYDRIQSENCFYCGVMGSIAGLISSPAAAVYAASKAAVCRCIESINIELEAKQFRNRILNVSPSNIKGARFDGGENHLELLEDLAEEIVNRVLAAETLYIPEFEKIFRDVLERYHTDPHAFGLQSYEYKKQSGRMANVTNVKIGYLSGTFDLFHVGHLNLLKRAKEQCDYLIVGVHRSGLRKGKETFIPLEERKMMVESCKYVDRVVDAKDEDSDMWDDLHYHRLFVGSDYKGTERFERYEQYFMDKNVQIIYFPYTTGTSSTQIRGLIKRIQ